MRTILSASLVSLVLATALACAGSGPRAVRSPARAAGGGEAGAPPHHEVRAEPEGEGEGEREEVREVDPEIARATAEALERARANGGTWHALHLTTECADDAGFQRVELFGDGVGIWQGRKQFLLDHDQLAAVLDLLRKADFATMPEMFGSEEEEVPIPQDPDQGRGSILRVTCRVILALDGVTKQSNQLSDGPQSKELHALAEGIIDLCRKPGEGGLRALNMTDGLKKIADGRLAPETLSLLLHRKPETAAIAQGEPGFLMRLRGERVTVRPFLGTEGYGEPVAFELSREQIAELANQLSENGLGTLPANLYAEHYTDLTVDLLDQRAEIQARQFARMTHSSHGAAQTGFDRIYTGLAALARQVLEEGTPAPRR